MTEPALGPESLGVVRRKRHCKLCNFTSTNSAEFVKHQQQQHNSHIQVQVFGEEQPKELKSGHIDTVDCGLKGENSKKIKMAHSPSKDDLNTGEDNNNAMKSLMPTTKNDATDNALVNNINGMYKQNGFITHNKPAMNGHTDFLANSNTDNGKSSHQADKGMNYFGDLSDDDDNKDLVIDEDIDTSIPSRRESLAAETEPKGYEKVDESVQEKKSVSPILVAESNAIEKMRSLFGGVHPATITSLASDNTSVIQPPIKHIVIEPQPMDDLPYVGKSNLSALYNSSLSSSSHTPVSASPAKRCAPVREAVDPAKYITVQEGDGIKYACSKCGNIYKWRKSLNKHWKEKHEGEIPEPRTTNSMPTITLPRINPSSFHPSSVNSNRVIPQVSPRNVQTSPREVKYPNNFTNTLPRGNPFSPKMNSSYTSPNYTSTPKLQHPSLPSPGAMASFMRNQKSPLDNFANSAVMKYLTKQHSPIKMSSLQEDTKPSQLSPPNAHSNKPTPRYIPPRPVPIDAPIDLTRDLPIIAPPRHEPEAILDLSRKRSLSGKSSFFDLPPQDEPLDFSGGGKKMDISSFEEKNSVPIRSWNLPVKIEREYSDNLHYPVKETKLVVKAPEPPAIKSIHCHVCTYVTRNQDDMDLHMQLHSTEDQFLCAECQESYSSLEVLNQHFAVDHMKAITKHMTELRKEQNSENQQNSGPQLYQYLTMDPRKNAKSCLVCGALYQWQWALAKHFEQDHSSLPNPYQLAAEEHEEVIKVSPAKSDKQLKCSQCPFTATNVSDLTRHQIRHSLNKHHICKVCGYTARTKEELGEHYSEDHPNVDPLELKSTTGTVLLNGTYGEDSSHSPEDSGLLGPDGKPLLDLSGENIAIVIPQAPEDSNGNSNNRSKAGRKPNTSGPSSVDVLLPYKCTSCEYRARWPSEITQHMKNHSDEKPFLCPRCTYRSKWKWDVVKHLKRCGGGTVKDVIDTTRLRKNQQANQMAGRPESIAYTQGRELSNGPPNVTVVPGGNVDKSPYSMSDNQSNHSTDDDDQIVYKEYDTLQCTKCSFVASSPSELKRHVKFHSYDANQVYCTQCPFVGNNPAELKRHLRVHSDEKPFVCKTCGYSSKWKCDLKKHCNTYNHTPMQPLTYGGHGRKPNVNKHDELSESVASDENVESNEDDEASDENSEYKCQKCLFVSKSLGLYSAHMRIHTTPDKSSYNCKQCDFESDDLSSYLQHNLIHSSSAGMQGTNEEPMNDSDNGDTDPEAKEQVSSNRRKQSKQTIMKAVLNEDDASMSEDNASNLEEKHQPISSSERYATFNGKVYSCTYCPYSTHNRANFERHMPHHKILSKYSCEWCNWSSDRLNLLYRHAQVIHQEQVSQHEKEIFYDKVKERCNYSNDGSVSSYDMSFPESDVPSSEFVQAKNGNLFSEGKKTKRRLKTCGKCGYVTDNVTTLQRHMAKHGKLGKFTCTYCDYSVDKQHVLDYHTSSVHVKQMPNQHLLTEALEGDHTSNSTIDFNDDASIENGSINSDFDNNVINDDNRSVNLESADISTVQGEDVKIVHVGTRTVYGCTKCPYHTMKISGVLNHSRQHGQKKRFTCTYCNYSVDQSAHVKNHMKTVHGHNVDAMNPVDLIRSRFDLEDMDSTDIASNGNDSEFQDDDGEYEPQSKRICLDSSAKKLTQNIFKCSKCTHVTFDKTEWLKHKLVHMSEPRPPIVKSHLCDKCPYRTGNRSQLEAHKTRHGVPSKYDCPYCDYSCGNATQQGNHVKLHFPDNQDMDKSVLQQLIKGEIVEGYQPVANNQMQLSSPMQQGGDHIDSMHQINGSPAKINSTDINCNTAVSAN